MTADIIHLTTNVTRQKAILEAFNAAASVLDKFDLAAFQNIQKYRNYQIIDDLISDIVAHIPSDEDVRQIFTDGVRSFFFEMLTNFDYSDSDNPEAVQEAIDILKPALLKKFKFLGIQTGLLEGMFRNPQQQLTM